MILNTYAAKSEGPCTWKTLITGLALALLMVAMILGANLSVAYASDQDSAAPAPTSTSDYPTAQSGTPVMGQLDIAPLMEVGQVLEYDLAGVVTDSGGEQSTLTSRSNDARIVSTAVQNGKLVLTAVDPGRVQVYYGAENSHGSTARSTYIKVQRTVSRQIPENSAWGTNLGEPITGNSLDSTTPSYSLHQTFAPFSIDSATGQIKVSNANRVDYESDYGNTYTVYVKYAILGDTLSWVVVNIQVTDVNEPPDKPGSPTLERLETGTVGQFGIVASWSEPGNTGPDITSYDVRWKKNVGGASWSAPVRITDLSDLRYEITNLESNTEYQVQVRATNDEGTGGWSDAGTGRTNIPPAFDPVPVLAVDENAAGGTLPGNPVTATDPEGDTLSYALDDPAGNFAINAATGQISVAAGGASLDHDANPTQTVTVTATDGYGSKATSEVTIYVTKRETRSVDEHAQGGTSVGSPVRSGSASYTLYGTKSSHFAISQTGQIAVAQGATLDYETHPEYDLRVEFPSGGKTAHFFVTITLQDVVPDAPEAPVAERNPANPDLSIKVTWTAPADNGEPITGYTVRYSGGGSQGEESFSGAGTQGIVSVPNPATAYTVQVRADADGEDGPWSPDSNAVTTKGPPTLAEPQDGSGNVNREVFENSPQGTAVGTPLSFVDPDGDSLTFKIGAEAGTPAGWFTIDPATGQIRVGAPAALDFEASGSYGVSVEVSDNDPDAATDLTQTVIITIVDEPQLPPPSLVVATYSPTSLRASWTEPEGEGPSPVTDYDVQYRLAGAGPEWTDHEFSGTGRDAIIRNLSPSTLYHVRVRAASDEDPGQWSDFQQARTRSKDSDGAQILTETRVVAENAAPGTLLGAPVQATDPLDHALQYVMYIGQDRFRVDPASGQITVAEGADLDYETRTSHTVEIEAMHEEEVDGEQHVIIDAIITVNVQVTDVDEPPLRPTGLVMTPGTTTMRVTWEPPAPNGSPPVNDYRGFYWVETINDVQHMGRLGNVTEVVITGLKPATHYGFSIKAINDEGQSNANHAWKTTLSAPRPTPASDPTLSALSLTDSDGMDVTLTADVATHWNTLNCSERNDRVGAADQPDDETSPYCRMYDELDAEAKAVVDQTYADDPVEGFASDINMYYATVASGVDMVTVSATAGAGAEGVSGDVGDVSLDVGENTITVTAENGSTTMDYTGMVTRETDEERLLRIYDTNGNGSIDPEELSDAIIDYLDGTLSPSDMSILIVLYLG